MSNVVSSRSNGSFGFSRFALSSISVSKPSDEKQRELDFQQLKQSVHDEVVHSLDLVASELTEEQFRQQLGPFVTQLLSSHPREMSSEQQQRLLDELPSEMFGIGPLEPLMADPSVSDILVNRHDEIFVERNGRLESTEIVFADEDHLLRIIRRIASNVGRRIDEVCPMVDARLPDGSRVNAVIAPLALDGPKLSIRRFGKSFLDIEKLVRNETLSWEIADFLSAAVRARVSVMISGGTGSGKTTLLNALSRSISPSERIVTIEDSAELLLRHPHVARLETRPANSEGNGQYTQRDLLRNSLRMRPDRIIVGEVRGPEALDMLQAMNTGHDGSLTTIHANDTHDAVTRLEMMVAMTGLELPSRVVRSYIASGIELVVQLSRMAGGQRRVLRVSELATSPDGNIQLQDVFVFNQVRNTFEPSGRKPDCRLKIEQMQSEAE